MVQMIKSYQGLRFLSCCWWRVWNIVRIIRTWLRHKVSKCYGDNDTDWLACCRVAINLQFVKNKRSWNTIQWDMPVQQKWWAVTSTIRLFKDCGFWRECCLSFWTTHLSLTLGEAKWHVMRQSFGAHMSSEVHMSKPGSKFFPSCALRWLQFWLTPWLQLCERPWS